MRPLGAPELVLLLAVALVVVPIWISQKAKPLGGLPYKWGTFMGIVTAMLAISLGTTMLIGNAPISLLELGLAGVLIACALAGAVGTLRRRQWGAIAILLAYLPLAVAGPSYILGVLLLSVGNALYFKKRWTLMALGQQQNRLPVTVEDARTPASIPPLNR